MDNSKHDKRAMPVLNPKEAKFVKYFAFACFALVALLIPFAVYVTIA